MCVPFVASGLLYVAFVAVRSQAERGFTLIELLVVVAIVGILTGIALPQFAGRQGAAFDARVESDTRLAAIAQEAYFTDGLTYSSDCTSLPGFEPSPGVVFTQCTGDATGFQLAADHPNSNKTCSFDNLRDPTFACTAK
jgi:prepilin-type N-terminal cleavage/methylation domain-containing protein